MVYRLGYRQEKNRLNIHSLSKIFHTFASWRLTLPSMAALRESGKSAIVMCQLLTIGDLQAGLACHEYAALAYYQKK